MKSYFYHNLIVMTFLSFKCYFDNRDCLVLMIANIYGFFLSDHNFSSKLNSVKSHNFWFSLLNEKIRKQTKNKGAIKSFSIHKDN